MKRMNEKNVFMLKGVLSGAVLMALLVTVVCGLGTGIAGFLLTLLIMAAAGISGWAAGRQSRMRQDAGMAYQRGYRAGLAKKTLVINQPGCRYTVTVSGEDMEWDKWMEERGYGSNGAGKEQIYKDRRI